MEVGIECFIHSTGTDTFNRSVVIKGEAKNYGEDVYSIKYDPFICTKSHTDTLSASDFAKCTGGIAGNRKNSFHVAPYRTD